MTKKDLEATIKEKISPLLEESMERNWGITIPKVESDITDKLKKPLLDIYIPLHKPFQEAKKSFKEGFLKKELKLHLGNVSQLAKRLGLDRRSIHRAIKDLDINMGAVREQKRSLQVHQEVVIDQTIRGALKEYTEIIQPHQLQKIYEDIPTLSRNIAKFIPHQELTWKEAEQEFEKVFLENALEKSEWNISKTAERIDIRVETLHRKIKKLGLRRN